jgi:copper chaperone CopZ
MEFNIPAMSCGHCAGVITQAVKSLDPAAQVNVDLASKKVVVQSVARPAGRSGGAGRSGLSRTVSAPISDGKDVLASIEWPFLPY